MKGTRAGTKRTRDEEQTDTEKARKSVGSPIANSVRTRRSVSNDLSKGSPRAKEIQPSEKGKETKSESPATPSRNSRHKVNKAEETLSKKEQTTEPPSKKTKTVSPVKKSGQTDVVANPESSPTKTRHSTRLETRETVSLQCLKKPELNSDKEKDAWSNYKGQFKTLCDALHVEKPPGSSSVTQDSEKTPKKKNSISESTECKQGKQLNEKTKSEVSNSPAPGTGKRGRRSLKADNEKSIESEKKDSREDSDDAAPAPKRQRGRPAKTPKTPAKSDTTVGIEDKATSSQRKRKATSSSENEESTIPLDAPENVTTKDRKQEKNKENCNETLNKEQMHEKDDAKNVDMTETPMDIGDHSYPAKLQSGGADMQVSSGDILPDLTDNKKDEQTTANNISHNAEKSSSTKQQKMASTKETPPRKSKNINTDKRDKKLEETNKSDHCYPVIEQNTTRRTDRMNRRKYNFSCSHCKQEFMLEYLLEQHSKSCKLGKRKSSGTLDRKSLDTTKCLKTEKVEESLQPIDQISVEVTASEKKDDLPNENTKNDLPAKTTKDDSQAKTSKDDSPAKTTKDDSPAKTSKDDSPAKTTKDDSPAQTTKDDSPAKTTKDDSPAKTTKDDSPAKTTKDDSPAKTTKDDSPAKTIKDDSSAKTTKDDSPAKTMNDDDSNVVDTNVVEANNADANVVDANAEIIVVRSTDDQIVYQRSSPIKETKQQTPKKSVKQVSLLKSFEDIVRDSEEIVTNLKYKAQEQNKTAEPEQEKELQISTKEQSVTENEMVLVSEALLQMQTGGNTTKEDPVLKEQELTVQPKIIIINTETNEVNIEDVVDETEEEQSETSESKELSENVQTQKESSSTQTVNRLAKRLKKGSSKKTEDEIVITPEILESLQCPICSKVFKAVEYLKRHMIVHSSKLKEIQCQVCCKSFTRKYDLQIHLIRLHNWVRTKRGTVVDQHELKEDGEVLKTEIEEEEIIEKDHTCSICKEKFDDNEFLLKHIKDEHPDSKRFQCSQCELKFAKLSQLKSHFSEDHSDKTFPENDHEEEDETFPCITCGKEFLTKAFLDHHFAKYHENSTMKLPIKCPQCEEVFQSSRDFNSHIINVHNTERIFKCDVCDKSFFRQAHLVRHSYTHLPERNYKCEECEKSYKDPDALKKHVKLFHSGAESGEREEYPCAKCNKVFSSPTYLKRHEYRHSGARPYKCHTCNKMFAEKNSLRSHARIHTGERPFKCDSCDKTFVQASHLHRHRFLHTQIRNVECDQCGKKFFEKSDLSKHLRQHADIKPYKCDICGIAFSQKSTLVCHRRRHTGEKPYVCDICERAFTQLSSLQTHHRLHTGERPYKCQYCDQGFVSKERMKVHQYSHTGVLPHVCNICGKGFKLQFKLQNHIDLHHGVFRHKCQMCDKAFNERFRLNRHIKLVHGMVAIAPTSGQKSETQYVYCIDERKDVPQEIIVSSIPHTVAVGQESQAQEIVEYVTIPVSSTEENTEANHAVSHITVEEGTELSAFLESMPQDSVIYEGEDEGEKVVYVVIPEENETVILS